MSNWRTMTTRNGRKPSFAGRNGNSNKRVMPRTRKDATQDKQLENLKKNLRSLKGDIDLKHKDTLINAEMVADPVLGTHILLLNGLVRGTADDQRIADLTRFTSLQFKGEIELDTLNVFGSTWRIIIFRDKQANGAGPTAAMLLDAAIITRLIDAPYNDDRFPRFKILYDRKGVINPEMPIGTATVAPPGVNTTTTVGTKLTTVNFRLKLNVRTNYGLANAGDVTDISTNSFYIMLLSDETVASAIAPTMIAGIRMYYKDA